MKVLFTVLMIAIFGFSIEIKSKQEQSILLELFTSEGCSSCPPADDWINSFIDKKTLFTQIVPVVFHVDYWDRLGWVDKFAKHKYTQRQYSYSNAWGTSSVYTPGFVLNGKEFKNWYFLKIKSQISREKVGILKADIKTKTIDIDFKSTNLKNKKVIINVSILGMNFISKIKAGENNGETFNHNFVSILLKKQESEIKNNSLKQTINFPYFKKDNGRKYAIAIWISDIKTKRVIQSIGSYL